MIFDLIGDIRAVLEAMPSSHRQFQTVELVAEALSQNADFVSRHPTVLFQNLWNAFWWYDWPQIKHHFDFADQEATDTSKLKTPLYAIAGRWLLESKASTAMESYWVRGLRPGWDRIGSGLVLKLRTTSNSISSLEWSEDGTRIVGGSYDVTARIWNAQTGQELFVLDAMEDPLFSTLATQTEWCARGFGCIRDCRWSPCQKFVAAACEDGVVRIYDAMTGLRLASLLESVRSIRSVAWFPDGNFLVTSSGVIWDWRDQTIAGRLSTFGRDVEDVDCSAGGIVAVALSDGSICLEHPERSLRQRYQPNCVLICCLQWSHNGKQLAFGTNSGEVRVLCVDTDSSVSVCSQETAVLSVAWSHDGNWLATGAVNGTVRVWSTSNWAEIAHFKAHCGRVEGICWSPDSELLASGGGDRTVRVWRRSKLGKLSRPINHSDDILAIKWSADGQVLSSRSADQSLAFWDALTGVRRGVHSHRGIKCVDALWSPGKSMLASAMSDGTIRLLDRDGQLIATLVDDGVGMTSICWSADGQNLISGSANGTVCVWDSCSFAKARTWKLLGSVRSVVSSPHENRVAIATDRAELSIHDMCAGATFPCLCDHDIADMSWSPDGQYLATMSWSSGVIYMYAKQGGEPIWHHRVSNHDGVQWSNDGRRVHATSILGRETFIAATGEVDQADSDVKKNEKGAIQSSYDPLGNETTIEVDGLVAGWIPEIGCLKNPKYSIWAGYEKNHLHIWLLQQHSNVTSVLPEPRKTSTLARSPTKLQSLRMFPSGKKQSMSHMEAVAGAEPDKSTKQFEERESISNQEHLSSGSHASHLTCNLPQVDDPAITPETSRDLKSNLENSEEFSRLVDAARSIWIHNCGKITWWQRVRCPAPPMDSYDGNEAKLILWRQVLSNYEQEWRYWHSRTWWQRLYLHPPVLDLQHFAANESLKMKDASRRKIE